MKKRTREINSRAVQAPQRAWMWNEAGGADTGDKQTTLR